MKKFLAVVVLVVFWLLSFSMLSLAGDFVECKAIWTNQSVDAGSYVETLAIGLSSTARSPDVKASWVVRSGGILSLQPNVTEGTFTFTVYFSNYPDASVWDSGTDIATGITSGDTDRIAIDPDGVALWMKIRATETSGTGTPSLSALLCTD